MTSLVDGVRAVILADTTGTGAVMPQLPDGAAGVLGGDTSPLPPAPNQPSLYVELEVESPDPAVGIDVQGVLRVRGYDWPHAGYGRLQRLLTRCVSLFEQYGEQQATANLDLYTDTATGEAVWWQGPGALGPRSVDLPANLLQMWADWPIRKTMGVGP